MVIYSGYTETIQNLPSICDNQNGSRCYGVIQYSEKDQIPLLLLCSNGEANYTFAASSIFTKLSVGTTALTLWVYTIWHGNA